MARKIAKVKSTGGSGFDFADRVAAFCLLRMLDDKPVFGLRDKRVIAISFETRVSGWLLDDLLLKLEGISGAASCGVSIKSAAYLKTSGFSGEFVDDLWEQWRNSNSEPFNPKRDYLALAVGELSDTAARAWNDIEELVPNADPVHLKDQLTTERSSSATERKIFKSLLPPAEAKKGTTAIEVARLLARLRIRHFSEQTEADAVAACTSLLYAGDQKQGTSLWQRLLKVATELRVAAGTLSVEDLIGQLRGDFPLREHPHYAGAWEQLNQQSQANAAAVHALIGANTHISFAPFVESLSEKNTNGTTVVVLGESGVGKSSLVKEYAERQRSQRNLIWLSGDQLAAQNQNVLAKYLGLAFELPVLVRNSTRPVLLVVDAIDIFQTTSLQRLREIIAALTVHGSPSFEIVMTAQPLRWSQAKREIHSWGLEGLQEFPFAGPGFDEISSALSINALVVPLFYRPELRRVVTNLAALDQIIKFASTPEVMTGREWIGETEVIDWVWQSWTGQDREKHQRGALLRELGQLEAETGSVIPISRISTGFLVTLEDPKDHCAF